jgi:hypothetical protein
MQYNIQSLSAVVWLTESVTKILQNIQMLHKSSNICIDLKEAG